MALYGVGIRAGDVGLQPPEQTAQVRDFRLELLHSIG